MDFKIVEKEAFNFVGVSKRVAFQFEGVNNEIVQLASQITEEQKRELHQLQNMEPYEIVNVSYDSDSDFLEEKGHLTHLVGVLITREDFSNQFDKYSMPACTWAVFPNKGPFPSTLQNTMTKIYSKWLPASNYELAFSFTKMNEYKEDYAYSEIWIPVKLKK